MTPRKKPAAEVASTPVHITDVDKAVQKDAADAANAIAVRTWKKEMVALYITAIISVMGTTAAISNAYFQYKTQLAVIEGTTISKQNHDLSNSLMLAMKKSLAEAARQLADVSADPNSPFFKDHDSYVARAEVFEAAYAAHKKTHDEMQASAKVQSEP